VSCNPTPVASGPTPNSNHFQHIESVAARVFRLQKNWIKENALFRLEKLTFLHPVPQWGEKDTTENARSSYDPLSSN
jgi:hypothetical protein